MKPYDYSFLIKHPNGSVDIFPVIFERSLKSKAIKIIPNLAKRTIKISYPIYVLKKKAVEFLENNKSWISKQLENIPETINISDNTDINFIGDKYKIRHVPTARRGVWIEDNYIFVSGDKEFLNRRVKDFLKVEFKKYLNLRVKFYADKINKSYNKISIKDTSSRWGSCASNGNLSFSWRLCFSPIGVIDYVVAHEVAHLKELNHSNNFWKIVYDICEYNVDEAIKWLSDKGLLIHYID